MFVLIMLCRDWAGWGRYLLVCSNIRVKVSRGGRSRQDAVVGRGATGEKDLLDWVGGLGGHADSGEGWAEEVGGREAGREGTCGGVEEGNGLQATKRIQTVLSVGRGGRRGGWRRMAGRGRVRVGKCLLRRQDWLRSLFDQCRAAGGVGACFQVVRSLLTLLATQLEPAPLEPGAVVAVGSGSVSYCYWEELLLSTVCLVTWGES